MNLSFQRTLVIVVDNMRLGGIQRLALDQMYELKDAGMYSFLFIRNMHETLGNPNFLKVESEGIRSKDLKIVPLPNGTFKEIFFYVKFFRKNEVFKVVNHSVGACISLRIALLLSMRKAPIHTFIHQLPTLSAQIQRAKRFIYVQFSTSVHAYSMAVMSDWNSRVRRNFLSRILVGRKKLNLVRNGVYLARLPNVIAASNIEEIPRIIFIGRSVGWKNLDFLFSILRHGRGKDFKLCIIVPQIDSTIEQKIKEEFGQRVSFVLGKKIQDISFKSGDVNVYPVNYGATANYVESISLNCLEMACLGIPSLVTQNGLETWPEISEYGLIATSDWSSLDTICDQIDSLSKFRPTNESLVDLRNIISIRNNTSAILKL